MFGAARYASRSFQPESAMAIVAVYQFRARFRTHYDSLDAPPKVGLSREGLLLLKQDDTEQHDDAATAACASLGAFDPVFSFFGLLDPAKLEEPHNHDFKPLYEKALATGSALSYNPNSAPPEETGYVAQWSLQPDKR